MRHLLSLLHFVRGVLLALLSVLVVLALLTAKFESIALSDAVYFIFITALTIGYGDITPSSGVTQVISVLAGIVGVIFVGLLVAVSVRALRDAVDETRYPDMAKRPHENEC